jgi:hypothetical protein
MPTKRVILDRPRRVTCSAEVVTLFTGLDATSKRARGSDGFKAKERELMQALGLSGEWRFSCCSVLDRSREPCHPPGSPAAIDWHRVRRVREQLLDVAKQGKATKRPSISGMGDVLDGREDSAEPRELR